MLVYMETIFFLNLAYSLRSMIIGSMFTQITVYTRIPCVISSDIPIIPLSYIPFRQLNLEADSVFFFLQTSVFLRTQTL